MKNAADLTNGRVAVDLLMVREGLFALTRRRRLRECEVPKRGKVEGEIGPAGKCSAEVENSGKLVLENGKSEKSNNAAGLSC